MTRSAMELLVTLISSCLLFSTALGLQCYQCIPGPTGSCENTVIDYCPDQCGSMTTFMNMNGVFSNISVKSCMTAMQCINGSIAMANQTTNINVKCCTTDLCNKETMPALMDQTANGLKCYTCPGQLCSFNCQGDHCMKPLETVDCSGNEDRCINIKSSAFGITTFLEGCATKSLCDLAVVQATIGTGTDVKCCQGNLCNGAESFTLSFLPMLVPLLFIVVFH